MTGPGLKSSYCAISLSVVFAVFVTAIPSVSAETNSDSSRISDEVLPFQTESIPARPRPIIELGDPFLSTGELSRGFKLPTGAVWQPSLIVWGTYRTALQTFDDSRERVTEWANRFDLFGNLYLSRTERIVIGFRPLDKNGEFTGYTFQSPNGEEDNSSVNAFNFDIDTLFFEGDFGELFPFLDKHDTRGLDLGLAVGRQPIAFQEGILIDDKIDALGVSKINLKPFWAVNYRMTLLWAWDELNRTNLPTDDSGSSLYGFFNEIDFRATTVEIDFAYVDGDVDSDVDGNGSIVGGTGDGYYGGLGATQRLGHYNSSFRVLGSSGSGAETEHNKDGVLLFTEISRAPHGTDDNVYLNGFWAIDNFRSASRGPDAGGPLGPTGVLFASVGLGRYRAALDSRADDAYGGALGYQMFFANNRRQLLLELGGRYATEDIGQRAVALGLSAQTALWTRFVIRADTFGSYGALRIIPEDTEEDFGYGGRLELQLRL